MATLAELLRYGGSGGTTTNVPVSALPENSPARGLSKGSPGTHFVNYKLYGVSPGALYNVDPTEGIGAVYRQLLGRDPDEAGLQYWKDQQKNGASYNDFLQGIKGSQERTGVTPEQRTYVQGQYSAGFPSLVNMGARSGQPTYSGKDSAVRSTYQEMLGRMPSMAELAYYEPLFAQNGNDANWLRRTVMQSPEHETYKTTGIAAQTQWDQNNPFDQVYARQADPAYQDAYLKKSDPNAWQNKQYTSANRTAVDEAKAAWDAAMAAWNGQYDMKSYQPVLQARSDYWHARDLQSAYSAATYGKGQEIFVDPEGMKRYEWLQQQKPSFLGQYYGADGQMLKANLEPGQWGDRRANNGVLVNNWGKLGGNYGGYQPGVYGGSSNKGLGSVVSPDWIKPNEQSQWGNNFGEGGYRLTPQGGNSGASWVNEQNPLNSQQVAGPGMTLGRLTGRRR